MFTGIVVPTGEWCDLAADKRLAGVLTTELFGDVGQWRLLYRHGGPNLWRIGWGRGAARNLADIVYEIVGEGPTPLAAYRDAARQLLPRSHRESLAAARPTR